ncbi:MAG: putative integral rane protein [Frankiales bacterium]|nr:putative integral rane protein [Frankiales bacterium]
MASPRALLTGARTRLPLLDHLVRAAQRYKDDKGDRLAAGVTYYFFLSMFPILLLAVSILGYVYGDDARTKVNDALAGSLPAGLADTLGQVLEKAKGKAGVLGLLGLLYAGLGLIAALRDALRTVWHQDPHAGNIVYRKVVDVFVLLGLLATVGVSVAVTGLVTGFSNDLLRLLRLDGRSGAQVYTSVAGIALAVLADLLLFLYLFTRLTDRRSPWKQALRGALLGAVGFEVLKVVGGFYVARTTSKGEATYGTFAVVVGLLLFLFLLCRLILFAAAFTVTAKGDSDVPPSGTANDIDPKVPVQVLPSAPVAGTDRVLVAARATAVAGGALLAGVGVYAAATLRQGLRRKR